MKSKLQSLQVLAQGYLLSMLKQISGMKCLILDQQTLGMVSLVLSQSTLLKQNVYLTTKISQKVQKINSFKAIYFIRPTKQNIKFICQQLQKPLFSQYHLFFSNQINQKLIAEIAQADKRDLVLSVEEAFLDFYPISKHCFSLKLNSTNLCLGKDLWGKEQSIQLQRIVDSLFSVALTLRVIPSIKFLNHSQACRDIAIRLGTKLDVQRKQNISKFNQSERAIFLITQRSQDSLTPLVTDWTYQAMLHQILGLKDNRINLKEGVSYAVSDVQGGNSDIVVSQKDDPFYQQNLNKNFADLYDSIKKWIDQIGAKQNRAIKIQSIQDMHMAVQAIPQLNALNQTLSKHITLSSQLTKIVNDRKLMESSRVQQDLACSTSRSDILSSLKKLLGNKDVKIYQKLKVVLIYFLRYGKIDKEMAILVQNLRSQGLEEKLIDLFQKLQNLNRKRKADLFFNKDLGTKAIKFVKSVIKDVPNVYCQHKPHLFNNVIPNLLSQKKEKQQIYSLAYTGLVGSQLKPLIVSFQIGGTTFAQAKQASVFQGARVYVGGTFVHNSRTFLAQVSNLGGK